MMPRVVGVRAKVERAAVELFAARGVDGVPIADIAAAAGVSQGALYRHYRSKDELASCLFSTAFLRTGAELEAIRRGSPGFAARVAAMVAHFCRLYDTDPALFRFLLIAQHDILPQVGDDGPAPAAVIEEVVSDAVAAREIAPIEIAAGAAAIMGVVLQ